MNASEITKSNYEPVLDLVFYKNNESEIYVEYAEIVGLQTKGYKPLSIAAYVKLSENFVVNKESQNFGFKSVIPSNVVHFSTSTVTPYIVWLSKSRYTTFWNKHNEQKMTYPHLLFILRDNALYIYAVKTMKIKETTPLFNTPFPNLYGDNRMCFGTMNIKNFISPDYQKTMSKLEDAFYLSKFTGELMNNNNYTPEEHKRMKDLLDKKVPFDNSLLKPSSKTVKNVLYR